MANPYPLENLKKQVGQCNRCGLSETRTHALCGEGDPDAILMLVAQAPGETEDRQGRMFIGPSGKVLDKLLQEVHIDRNKIYMTNLVKCMLPQYRRPKFEEIKACSRYLDREIEIVDPAILAPLGYYASRYLLAKYNLPLLPKKAFRDVCGSVFEVGNKKVIPLQHPAAVLHNRALEPVLLENYHKMQRLLPIQAEGRKG